MLPKNPNAAVIRASALWDGTGAPVVTDAVLAIDDGRIVAVGKWDDQFIGGAPPTVEFSGVTLLPALIDAHVHLSDDLWTWNGLLANGIAAVRDTGNRYQPLLTARQQRLDDGSSRPIIKTLGPLLDGDPPHWPHAACPLTENDDVEAVVDRLIEQGVDGLKTYVNAQSWLVERVVNRARYHGKRVSCHSGATPTSTALDLGMGCIEHAFCLDVLAPDESWSTISADSERVSQLIDRFLNAGAWFCPTLAVMEAVQHGWGPLFWATYPDDSYPKHVSDWLKMVIDGAQSRTSDETTEAAASLEQMKKVVRCFSEAGVPMMAGSDMPFVPAGTGLHRELELLVDAGIPNDQAMMMATSIPATYLGLQDEVGTLTVGASADVIAVRGNPLSDITAIGHMEAIWSEGERLDLEELKTKSKSDFDVEPTGFDGTPFGMRD